MSANSLAAAATLPGRIFLSMLFLAVAWITVSNYGATADYVADDTQHKIPVDK